MRVYTIHLRHGGLNPDRDLVAVKEGFSWPAFWLSVPWALWHRMWLAALAFLVVGLAVEAAIGALGLDPESLGVVALGIACAIGFLANDLRRSALVRRGFVPAGVAVGANADEALHRFLQSRPEIARDIAFASGAAGATP